MDGMDTATGIAADLIDRLERLGASRPLFAILLVLASFAVTVALAGLIQPVPETIVAAPFRW
jgi:hypothetical protein